MTISDGRCPICFTYGRDRNTGAHVCLGPVRDERFFTADFAKILNDEIATLKDAIKTLRAENERYRKALSFYRASKNYVPMPEMYSTDKRPMVIRDGGLTAYSALGGESCSNTE